MSFYKFGQVTVSSKEFYEAIDIDIKTLNIDNILVSDPILDNKKGKRYIIGYNIEGKIVALRIKTPIRMCTLMVFRNTVKHQNGVCLLILEGHDEWVEKYKKIWEAVEAQLFQSLTTEVVNKGKYINPKLNMYGDKIAVKYS